MIPCRLYDVNSSLHYLQSRPPYLHFLLELYSVFVLSLSRILVLACAFGMVGYLAAKTTCSGRGSGPRNGNFLNGPKIVSE